MKRTVSIMMQPPGAVTRIASYASLIGIIPLFATLTIEPEMLNKFPLFKDRISLSGILLVRRSVGKETDFFAHWLVASAYSVFSQRLLDKDEFFSGYGIRSHSKYQSDHQYCVTSYGKQFKVTYQLGESDGNTNWRGPIWMTINFLLIESLQRFFLFYGDQFQVE
ncbi:unnamed protein product [Fusarium venenatum]|uniref:Mannosyl-oligosaccharide glucosidase n=1 Tax=Fusarium venenatum TaxID=56646 RepID=A0A2L2TA14_9HYPO|nr:LOW QUALITY PROTEIN: uncharacterized protein FVRRES_04294 [Fusarium venenatum]CEI67782.1 unnamed protein product [Fusarium venenatum]